MKDGIRASDLLRRPEMTYEHIHLLVPSEVELSDEVTEQVEIQIKYEGYIEKSLQQVERMKKMENKKSLWILIMMQFLALHQKLDRN